MDTLMLDPSANGVMEMPDTEATSMESRILHEMREMFAKREVKDNLRDEKLQAGLKKLDDGLQKVRQRSSLLRRDMQRIFRVIEPDGSPERHLETRLLAIEHNQHHDKSRLSSMEKKVNSFIGWGLATLGTAVVGLVMALLAYLWNQILKGK